MEDFRPCDDQAAFVVSQEQQGVPRLDLLKFSGFFWNDDLSPVSHLCGTEDAAGLSLPQQMLAAGHGKRLPSNHTFHIFPTQ